MDPRRVRLMCAGLVCAAVLPSACRHYRAEQAPDQGGAGAGAAAGAADHAGGAAGAEDHAGSAAVESGGDASGGANGGAPALGGADGGMPSGSDGAGGWPADPAAPNEFEGLVLWLEASHCTVDDAKRVELCSDGSGHGNNASQAIAARRPKLTANGLNGRDVLTFDGGDPGEATLGVTALLVADAASLRMGTGEFSLVIVGRWRNDAKPINLGVAYAGYAGFFHKCEAEFPFRGIALFANYPSGYQNVPAVRRLAAQVELSSGVAYSYSNELNDNTYRVYAMRRSGADRLEVRINGMREGAAEIPATLDASAAYQQVIIGGAEKAALRGEIAEIAFIRGDTTEQELGRLELGMMQKYGL
jgi:hypothetical protein